ncbi:MAG: hypothetical protein ACRDFX_08375, partial [Chloroflexota bacterium]
MLAWPNMGTPPPSKQGLRNSIEIGRDDRIAFVLLVFPALTFVAALLGWPPAAQFFLSVLAIMPLAALIGTATEALANRLGGKTGGLLNATFGNAPDLLVGIFGVQRGLIPLVKATLIGGLISNSALIMGICYVIAGLLFHRPRFKREEAGHHSVLMMLTLAAVLFPSAGSLVLCGQICTSGPKSSTILHVSVGISVVLLLAYISYLVYGIFGLESLSRALPEGREVRAMRKHRDETAPAFWPVRFAIGVLAGATALLIPVTDILTSQVQQVTSVLHVSQVFVGLIVVANAGNVAEAYSAIRLTIQRGHLDPRKDDSGLDLALG